MMNVIEVNHLSKHFRNNKAVDNVSFSVEKGEVFGFLGPNGAGKTTTIRCMMDFIRPTSGSINILGFNAQKDSVKLKKKIGYLSGNLRLYDKWTGQDHIDFVSRLNGGTDIAQKISDRFNFDSAQKVKALSSGNKQKLGIIMAFMTEPELLIMDEPTNALDPLLQNTLYDLIGELTKHGTTVFMSSHNLSEVDRVCHKVGIIKNGKMVATESTRNLKDKRLYNVTAYFADNFESSEFELKGVIIKKIIAGGLILGVRGDLNELVGKLSRHNLRDLHIEHASLEEIFIEFYM
ncbi:MAG: ABC transporter ATP-binding protein [Patescibacteria group bacterium]|jgi:ABC-2 type transport system ATP-binding protein